MKAIITAGGKGTRMKRINDIPKVFQSLYDTPIIEIEIRKLIQSGFKEEDIILVLSPDTHSYAIEHLSYKNTQIVIQVEANGSGGAVKTCMDIIKDDEWILIMSGDSPLFHVSSIQQIILANRPCLTVTEVDDPLGFGRVILKDNMIKDIIEENDCTKAESQIRLVNTSIFYVKGSELKTSLNELNTNNIKNEYYLTHIVHTYPLHPHYLSESVEGYNINTPENLEEAKFFYLNPLPLPKRHKNITKNDKRLLVVTDIHGCFKTFMKLLETVSYKAHSDILISVGDIIMKGPDSKSVVNWFRTQADNVYCVRGNNEDRELGIGLLKKKEGLTDKDLSYLRSLPYTITVTDINLIIVHAGLIPGVALHDQKIYDMIKMRNIYCDKFDTLAGSHLDSIGTPWYEHWNGPFVIYGHDVLRGIVKSAHSLGTDTGCCYNKQLSICVIKDTVPCTNASIQIVSIENCE